VSHLHLPVQSGSDRVLAAMKRGYTVLEYKSLVRKLRAARPDISLSSDFIIGFPRRDRGRFRGHHEADRRSRLRRVLQLRLQPRPGTPAAELADDTPQDVKLARLTRLQKRIEEQARPSAPHGRHGAAHSGRRAVAQGSQRAGRPHRQQPHRQLRRQPRLIGRFVDIRFTLPHSLRGEIARGICAARGVTGGVFSLAMRPPPTSKSSCHPV
jgi:tRNA-2-methylthio-N6-dimethylallyladenosine synthase